jgi:metal-sulfur cluster biosynthetic enzyme
MAKGAGGMVTKDQVFEALRTVYDPELGVNVVDLGLIYDVDIADNTVDITMTMTTPGCPLHQAITRGVQTTIGMLPDVFEARVELVWSPPWEPGMMSDAARALLC